MTIFGNRANADGSDGFFWGGGLGGFGVVMHNTLVVGNTSGVGGAVPDDLIGAVNPASSFNLVGNATVDGFTLGGIPDGVNGNRVGVNWVTVIDPALRDNGGPTRTHRLLPQGQAVDAGGDAQALDSSENPLLYDQRGPGHPRILQTTVDIGAYEAAPADDLIGFFDGTWYVGTSYGNGFGTTEWAQWTDAAWDALKTGDFDADGKADVLGLIDGEWYVGLSTGGGFVTGLWGRWANVAWEDVLVADLNGDGRDDVVAESAGAWYGAVSTGYAFLDPTLWTGTADADWDFATLADVNGDGKGDLLVMLDGEWYGAVSTGVAFADATLWAKWANVEWQGLGTFDVDNDGAADVWGLYGGESYLGRSRWSPLELSSNPNPAGFSTRLHGVWGNRDWRDVRAGDFDGDRLVDDLAARAGGEWWVASTEPSSSLFQRPAVAKVWASWAEVAWEDVRVGDFDGDGRDDLAGRYAGEWYVARSTGAAFATALWERWAEVDWTVLTGDATGSPAEAPAAVAIVEDEAPLAAFWAQAEEDEAFAGLLAAV